jgi:hypothetical protein
MQIDHMTNIVLLGLVGVLFIGLVLVIYGTVVKNKWGINLDPHSCPRCHEPLSQLRLPKTRTEFLWGGITCPRCGCSSDKWGRELQDSR